MAERAALPIAPVNPRSASTISPGSRSHKNVLSCVRFLSEVRPPQHPDSQDIVPHGVISTKNVTVLELEQVFERAEKLVGVSISEQSIITLQLG